VIAAVRRLTRPTSMATVVLIGVLAGGSAFAAPATTASDVCPGDPNPCNVTSSFEVTSNAVLDFGTRTVNVTGSGQFDFGSGSGTILCGGFTASTASPAINAKGPDGFGGTSSGAVSVQARRTCTIGNPAVPCLSESNCQLGACNARRCSLKSTRTCTIDANCKLGTCGAASKRCSASASVRCNTNADCDYGSCPEQLTCANAADSPVNCAVNADCDFGTCTVGTASISMGGSIVGNSASPASVSLRAADSISISKIVNLSSTTLEAEGGDLYAEASLGSVTVTATINAPGGGDAQGGAVELVAGTDVTVASDITVTGGDSDGGSVEISSGRDAVISRSLLASSVSGAGFGGEIIIDAGRDVTITGVGPANRTILETDGHTDIESFAGDGGAQDLTAGRNLALNVNTRISNDGSAPDGSGSDVSIDVDGDVLIGGTIRSRAIGIAGSGGFVDIFSGGATQVSSTGEFDVSGGEDGGGAIEFYSGGNVDFSGSAVASGTNGGTGGSAFISSDVNASVAGSMVVNGVGAGSLEVDACRVTLTGTALLDNKVAVGDNTLLARESMKLLAGSQMKTGGGPNQLLYRSAAKPPVISGTVSPAPQLVLSPALPGCPECGNAEIDQTETCDDGNTTNGDGCSSTCQNENCILQTGAPGYPDVPLCDDGNACTTDVCNTTLNGGTCQHPTKDCSDAFGCTVDSCVPGTGACLHTPNDAACDDSNVCTDNFCTEQSGCGSTNNTGSCPTDNNTCTENDTCVAGVCAGTPIEGCGVCGDSQVNAPEECDDGNATFTAGEYCGVACVLIPCGKPTNSTGALPKTSDALFVLKTAVGQNTCAKQVCDVDSNGNIVTNDALRVLRAAVGQTQVLNCPPPPS